MNEAMRRYALIGDPVAHSLSPAMQNAAFAACGIAATYEAIRVTHDELTQFVGSSRRDRLDGFNITTPLKEAILAYLDALTPEAQAARAANAARFEGDRLVGHNTDGSGLVAAVTDSWGWEPRGASALLLGAGPAARAIALALKRAGVVALSCWARDRGKAQAIAPPPHRQVDLVVSALPENANVPDAVLERIAPRTFVFDVNYAASRSPIPAGIGGKRSDGLPLLLHQGALSFEWWTGVKAPVEDMRRALGL